MELKEGYNDAIECNLHQCANGSNHCVNTDWRRSSRYVHNVKYKEWNLASNAECERYDNVEKEQHEKFSVRKPDAVRYPGAVVVHV